MNINRGPYISVGKSFLFVRYKIPFIFTRLPIFVAVYILTVYQQRSLINNLGFPAFERVCKSVFWRNDEVPHGVSKPDKSFFVYNSKKPFAEIVRAVIILKNIKEVFTFMIETFNMSYTVCNKPNSSNGICIDQWEYAINDCITFSIGISI